MNTITFVFQQGKWKSELSDLALLPTSVCFEQQDGKITLLIPDELQIHLPLRFVYQAGYENLQHAIVLGENSRITLIEEYSSQVGDACATKLTLNITLKQNASLEYYRMQYKGTDAHYQANIEINQYQSSQNKMFFSDWGAQQSTSEVNIRLLEKNASCTMHGVYFLHHDHQEVKNHFYVNHAAEHCLSEMVVKGVLDNKSKASFLGKVYVDEKAQHSHAHQANHHLLLSPHAQASAKPELEIYADDIKCAHGATVGQPDNDALFYLQSRGIEESEALSMLTEAFIAEVMEKIENVSIRQYIQERFGQYERI